MLISYDHESLVILRDEIIDEIDSNISMRFADNIADVNFDDELVKSVELSEAFIKTIVGLDESGSIKSYKRRKLKRDMGYIVNYLPKIGGMIKLSITLRNNEEFNIKLV